MPPSVSPRVFPGQNRKMRPKKKADKKLGKRLNVIRKRGLQCGTIIRLPRERHGRTIASVDTETGFVKLQGERKQFCPLSFVW